MDNIREKLVGLLTGCGICFHCLPSGIHEEQEKCRIVDHLIANGVTVQEWRPASDPPKEDCKDVLVYFEYFRYGEYNMLFRTIGIGYAWKGEWSTFVNGQSGWQQLKILAWMPLPEEPKGESEQMRKSCKTCGNSSNRPAASEACLTCAFGDDGTPTNWKELTSTNGDRVRDMCDGELAKFFAKKVIDQVALMAVESGRQIGGTQLAAMKEAYARSFFSWLRDPAEEGGK